MAYGALRGEGVGVEWDGYLDGSWLWAGGNPGHSFVPDSNRNLIPLIQLVLARICTRSTLLAVIEVSLCCSLPMAHGSLDPISSKNHQFWEFEPK
jgi:hypothetical protein